MREVNHFRWHLGTRLKTRKVGSRFAPELHAPVDKVQSHLQTRSPKANTNDLERSVRTDLLRRLEHATLEDLRLARNIREDVHVQRVVTDVEDPVTSKKHIVDKSVSRELASCQSSNSEPRICRLKHQRTQNRSDVNEWSITGASLSGCVTRGRHRVAKRHHARLSPSRYTSLSLAARHKGGQRYTRCVAWPLSWQLFPSKLAHHISSAPELLTFPADFSLPLLTR